MLLEGVPPHVEAAASWVLEPLVFMMARRLWKNKLASLWGEISAIERVQLVADSPHDLLLWNWNYERGREQTRLFDRPQSWKSLLLESRQDEDELLPSILKSNTDFKLVLLLCFPHRFNRPFAKHLERSFHQL